MSLYDLLRGLEAVHPAHADSLGELAKLIVHGRTQHRQTLLLAVAFTEAVPLPVMPPFSVRSPLT